MIEITILVSVWVCAALLSFFIFFRVEELHGYFYKQSEQIGKLFKEMNVLNMNQTEFNEKIDRANKAIDGLKISIEAETAQIEAYIEANPNVDTSALENVVARLESVGQSVGGIFEPDVTVGAEVVGATEVSGVAEVSAEAEGKVASSDGPPNPEPPVK